MRKKLLLLLLVTIVFTISGLFYFRYIKAQTISSEQDESTDEMFNGLIEEARQNGSVEIVINLKIAFRTESELNAQEIEQQRAKINQAQQDLLSRLKNFRVEVTRELKHIPYIIAKVDAEALRFMQTEKESFGVRKAESIALTANQAPTITEENKSGNLTSIVDSGTMTPKEGTAKSHRAKANTVQKIPDEPPEMEEEEEKSHQLVYHYTDVPGDNAVAPNPPTSVDNSILPKDESTEKPSVAPGDMQVFSFHDMNSAEAPPNSRLNINEPSVVNIGNGVFYTANVFAARSLDGGQSFTYVNPAGTFPSVNGGFCCDQVTAYAPAQDMIIWGLQYRNDGFTNTFRIARTIGLSGLSNNQWSYSGFTAQSFGLSSGLELDFPSMSVSNSYLYITMNIFNISNGSSAGCVVWRISLAQLASGGSINYSYAVYPTLQSLRLTEGAGATMHWTNLTGTTSPLVRVSHWADSGTQITFQEVAVNSFNYLNPTVAGGVGTAFSPDGTNWAGFADSRIEAGYVSGGVIGAMWGARQGGQFPYPYTIHARFNENTGALIYQGAIWNQNFAWLYPTASVNATGNLGGAISYGGGGTVSPYPNGAFWAIDDISNTLPLGASFSGTAGNAGPAANRWGDYLTVKPHKQYSNTWVAAMFYMNGGQSNSSTVSRYLWFGRERDGQATTNTHRPFDFDGDGKTDISIFRPSNGQWWIYRSSSSSTFAATFGNSADKIAPADYTGDGKADIAIWRPSTGEWFILRSENLTYYSIPFGTSGDIPAPGDFDNDGKANETVFRPSNASWYIRLPSGASTTVQFGANGDVPVVGDYDGDGRADTAVYRPSTGVWWLWRSSLGIVAYQFGNNLDKPAPGDYTGDGKADAAFFRPASGFWFILRSENQTYYPTQFGTSGDIASPGDYDGDGKHDPAVFRTSNNTWYVQRSTNINSPLIQTFGIGGDKPVPSAFVP
jgi:hypothetical protein